MLTLRMPTCFGFVLFLCLVAPSPARGACVGPPALEQKIRTNPGADTYTQLGMWFGDRHQYACAIENFQAALKLDPSSARVHFLLGLSLYVSGKPEDAVKPLQESIHLNSGILDSHLVLGNVLTDLHRDDEAAEQWEAALKIDPSSKAALDGLAKFLIAKEQYDSAIALLSSTPRDEDLTLDLATAFVREDRLNDAAALLNQALEAKPTSLPLRRALISIYVDERWIQEAAKQADLAAKLDPGNVKAQELRLHVLILNGDLAQANVLGPKLLREAPHDFETLYLNGVLEREAGETTKAKAHLEEALAVEPNHPNAHYNLGVTLESLGDAKDAKIHLQKAIDLGEKEPAIRFELAKALRSLGETQAAQEQLKVYQQELKAKADRTLAALKSAEASQQLAQGNIAEAVQLYRDAAAALPSNAYLQYQLALALEQKGDRDAERVALEAAIQMDSGFALAQHQLGYLDSQRGDFPSAENHFRIATRSAPGYTEAWISLAATLGMESKFHEGLDAVEIALRLEPDNKNAQELRSELAAAEAKH